MRMRSIALLQLPWLVVVVVLLMTMAAAWGWYASSLILRVPRLPVCGSPADHGLAYQSIAFHTADGLTLRGWFIPREGSDRTIIICHGWGANKADVLGGTLFLRRLAHSNLLYFDFRAHGDSDGSLSTIGCREVRDLEAAISFLRAEEPARSRAIGVMGFSMGGAVALRVAARQQVVRAVAVESAFADIPAVVARSARLFYGFRRFPLVDLGLLFMRLRLGADLVDQAPIRTVGLIAPRAVFIIQDEEDLRVTTAEGLALFDAAGEPREWWAVPASDHLEAYMRSPSVYEERVSNFFNHFLVVSAAEEGVL